MQKQTRWTEDRLLGRDRALSNELQDQLRGELFAVPNGVVETTSNNGDGEPANLGGELEMQKEPKCYYYEFIGECYVNGMMDGEAMKI